MTNQSNTSYKSTITYPLILGIILLILVIVSYSVSFNKDIKNEYNRLNDTINASVKILGALNYSFVSHFNSKSEIGIEYTAKNEDGMCRFDPKDKYIQSAYRQDAKQILSLDFSIKGFVKMCEPHYPVYDEATSMIRLAPLFSYLNSSSKITSGLYYMSDSGYQLASPAHLNDNLTLDAIPDSTVRHYWLRSLKVKFSDDVTQAITLDGPNKEASTDDQLLSMWTGIFDKDEFKGIILMDLSLNKLIMHRSRIGHQIKFARNIDLLPHHTFMPTPLMIDGVKSTQIMYYQWDNSQEIFNFICSNAPALFVIVILCLLLSISLRYTAKDSEQLYFEELSRLDPMTHLLNRRGFTAAYERRQLKTFESLAMFDIDDFKLINDSYGHDVGDSAICYVADTLKTNTRNTDIVARFGGEEFVVYLQSDDENSMLDVINRLQQRIANGSTSAVESGFTISTGFTSNQVSQQLSFYDLLKTADEKLYVAKTTGKNKVVS